MPVKKFILVQTFIKFKALQILPINRDCRFTNKHMNFLAFSRHRKQPPRNVLQKSCYASVVETLENNLPSNFSSSNATKSLQQRQSISQVSAWRFPHWCHPMFPTQFCRDSGWLFFLHFIRNVATLKAVSLILFFWLKLIWL